LQRRLSEILGRSVDLTTPDALHKALKDRIIKEAVRAALRFVVHEYFRASDSVIWDTVQVDLPPLPALLKKILEENSE
jgi:hypothetical protein